MFPSPAEVASAYEANKARFATPKLYHVAQIALLVPSTATKDIYDAAQHKLQGSVRKR